MVCKRYAHGVTRRRVELAKARRATGLTQEELAHRLGVDRSTVGRWEAGTVDPTLRARRELADALGVDAVALAGLLGDLPAFEPPSDDSGPLRPADLPAVTFDLVTGALQPAPRPGSTDLDHEVEALELGRRVTASDIGEPTLVRLEQVVDELAMAYLTTPPREVLDRTRGHLRYVTNLLGARKTLAEHRRLLVTGGWLSLLAATLHIDLEQQAAALARIRTARSIAEEAGHDELAAHAMETEAWRALTLCDFRRAANWAQAAQQRARVGSTAYIQAAAQEGRALARLGEPVAACLVVGRVGRLAEPLGRPDHPEHHFRYDLVKATSYTATTLTWIGDPSAVDHARDVVRSMTTDPAAGRVRRLALSRLDLSLALMQRDEVEEAADTAITAMRSRLFGSDLWRASEVVDRLAEFGERVAAPAREVYRELAARSA
jgi:transcriptional regulator with XRE-family HTH domain